MGLMSITFRLPTNYVELVLTGSNPGRMSLDPILQRHRFNAQGEWRHANAVRFNLGTLECDGCCSGTFTPNCCRNSVSKAEAGQAWLSVLDSDGYVDHDTIHAADMRAVDKEFAANFAADEVWELQNKLRAAQNKLARAEYEAKVADEVYHNYYVSSMETDSSLYR